MRDAFHEAKDWDALVDELRCDELKALVAEADRESTPKVVRRKQYGNILVKKDEFAAVFKSYLDGMLLPFSP